MRRFVFAGRVVAVALLLPILTADSALAQSKVRVFAMQYHLSPEHVTAYDSLFNKMKSFVGEIAPNFAADRPNLVVFNEDTGLTTLATGPRFVTTRALQSSPELSNPLYSITEPNGAPLGAAAAFASLAAGYAKEIAFYQAKFPGLSPKRAILVAATDTMARAFYIAFQRLAIELSAAQRRAHGAGCNCEVFIIAGNNMAPFEEVDFIKDPTVTALVDPEILVNGDPVSQRGPAINPFAFGQVSTAFVATEPEVYNTAFLWGPGGEVGRVRKVNLTPLEGPLLLDLSHGSIDQARPITLPGTNVRIGIGISLDAFQYGDPPCASAPGGCSEVEVCVEHEPVQPDPFANSMTSETYMRCLDARGATLFVQPEANPGRWADYIDGDQWQALTWMASDWRAVTEPTVGFRYSVVPFMVGNLLDIVFDGQSAIYERGRQGVGAHRVGDFQLVPRDAGSLAQYAGNKSETVALAPWVVGEGEDTYTTERADLVAVAGKLAPGSGDPLEDQYVESALCAELDLSDGGTASPCSGFIPPLRNGPTGP